ncbi:PaREP1 family protein [Saccharolobus islandicus]|uniref:PaREP1 family protein n=3 Tax=Saccharolobus islandicus TaxID=43080 RepID=C4KFS3_SACI6|nr:PaREP1 family protein [Sulfolobus islandicus]ACP37591.1 PaREP1 family protein [Sulfolobus islandicus M.14.25]ACP54734.1 PaREP1 family protein [Sulfolobus islandicus M.16.27]ACR41437.1 PaREP1 family protein [Sulfolobus islandicus M.16.4]
MESKIPTIEKHRDAYIKIKIIESLEELTLASKLLKEGFSRNSAGKIFLSWKAFISALTVMNLEKMPKDEKEKEWYYKTGFLTPTTGLKGISQRLEELGYKVNHLTSTALALHRYAYNGLYKGASDYSDRNEAIRDIISLSQEIIALVREYFKNYWDDEIENHYRIAEKELRKLLS